MNPSAWREAVPPVESACGHCCATCAHSWKWRYNEEDRETIGVCGLPQKRRDVLNRAVKVGDVCKAFEMEEAYELPAMTLVKERKKA
jgi:hypothetical protein